VLPASAACGFLTRIGAIQAWADPHTVLGLTSRAANQRMYA
jgi:hypothetical protein